ncbi:MAG: hypothetical protein ACK4UN_06355, partial [Limisphaerales bacterium]
KSFSFSFVLLLAICAVPPITGWAIYYENWSQFSTTYLLPSPVYAAVLAFDGPYQSKPNEFWTTTLLTHLYSWIFLFLACRIVPRSWQDRAASPRELLLQKKMMEITQGRAEVRKRYRTELLEKNPFLWVAARDRMKGRVLWIFLFACGALWLWGYSYVKKDWLNNGTYIFTALVLHTSLKCWLAGEASRRFVDDRRSGALELMLSTPIAVRDILRGQLMALWRQFSRPGACVLLLGGIFMIAGMDSHWGRAGIDWEWILVWVAGLTIFVFDLVALAWLGMWLGLTNQKVNRASGGAVARILFLPWLALGLTIAFFGILSLSPAIRQMLSFNLPDYFFTLYWFLLSAVNNVIWIVYAKRKLNERFREIATQRFDAPRSFWNFGASSRPPVLVTR